ncbi:MAG TPA: ATP-binding cassette domain-containing protein [Anaeromyxobacteraceae bacterium]|nr:ATP-binding cassette domain-containing protein [Anaeromyxobacteraceae bacterium]
MSAPLVELRGVTVLLGGRAALRGATFTLREGESWAVLGPNGSGKSTLLRTLRGELWPHHDGGGERVFHLSGGAEESPIGVRLRIGLVSPEGQQEYARRDWALPVEAVVRSGFTDEVWPPEAATPAQASRIAEVLAELGIAALARRSVLDLSSGEARKVMLARALVGRPRALFLDEPCHGLDAPSRAAFLALVSGVVRRGPPIVLATHRYEELVPEIGRVAVMHGGRILAQGNREEVLHRHRQAARVGPALSPALPRPLAGEGDPPPTSDTSTASIADEVVRPERSDATASRSRRAPSPLFVLEHADVHVEGTPVLHDLSWTIRRGESWAVVGPNGAGKSTLLRLLVGDEQAMPGGRVARLSLGERADVWEVKARVGIVSPELQARHRQDLPVDDVVASGFGSSIGLSEEPTPAQRAAAARALGELGVSHLAGRRIHGLSYGELRRVLLARALVRDPDLLVLDEPCDGLDPESRQALLEAVERLGRAGRQVVLVTHHLEDLVPSITHVLALERGRAVYQGPRAGWHAERPA